MTINLLEDTLQIDIFYERDDHDLEDNICVSIIERCAPEERLFCAGETYIYLTPQQARELGQALLIAANSSNQDEDRH
jgi:hypothetical protein